MKKITALFLLALMSIITMTAEEFMIPASVKPNSIRDALCGIKSIHFECYSNGQKIEGRQIPAADAYFANDVLKWAKEIIPSITSQTPYCEYDYTYSSNTHLNMTLSYGYYKQIDNYLGTYYLVVRDIVVKFRIGYSNKYIYQYQLPGFKYYSGYGSHEIYNALKEYVCGTTCYYNPSKVLQLETITTEWNEQKIKAYLQMSNDPIEGIYLSTKADNNSTQNKYKVAVLKMENSNKYMLVYIDGAYLYSNWKEGDLKAILTSTATQGIFQAHWYSLHKELDNNYFLLFTQTGLIVGRDGIDDEQYLKIFPTANMQINTQGWSGTGFALSDPYIATNYHVIENAKDIKITGVKGNFTNEYTASVVAVDKNNDIAIIKINDNNFNGFGTIPYKLQNKIAEVGEVVWALGYPMTDVMGEEIKFTDGKISSRTGFQGDLSCYQISVPIQPGNSGGPLFDNNGNIIGITSSTLNRDKFSTENVNYAIKISYLKNLVESSLSTDILPHGDLMQGQSLTQKIKLAKTCVLYIKCR